MTRERHFDDMLAIVKVKLTSVLAATARDSRSLSGLIYSRPRMVSITARGAP